MCGRLFERRGELLHRADGLAELAAQAGSSPIERLEHLLLAVGLGLFARQHVAVLRIHRGNRNDVMRAQAADGAGEHGLGAFAQADFARNVVSNAFLRRPAHEAQRLANARFRQQVQVRRLLQLHRQCLLQRSVKYGVAGGVDEVGENHGVLFRERVRAPGALKEEQTAADQRCDQHDDSDGCGDVPGFPGRCGRRGKPRLYDAGGGARRTGCHGCT
jgi:hypothetical protein